MRANFVRSNDPKTSLKVGANYRFDHLPHGTKILYIIGNRGHEWIELNRWILPRIDLDGYRLDGGYDQGKYFSKFEDAYTEAQKMIKDYNIRTTPEIDLVNESLNFQRGVDPKTSLDIGEWVNAPFLTLSISNYSGLSGGWDQWYVDVPKGFKGITQTFDGNVEFENVQTGRSEDKIYSHVNWVEWAKHEIGEEKLTEIEEWITDNFDEMMSRWEKNGNPVD